MTVDTTIRRWNQPSGDMSKSDLAKLSATVNQIEGLHSAVVPHNVQLQSQDRCMWLGPMTTPVGVIVTVNPGAVLLTL